ncbi:hypothetical protein GA0070611_4021 [Micromonospora auratinigra]|uniref:Uncharacterized protein n=1 Tax=Micromonospora auratinigra TaxID=261654 RepID=A0A1A8ZWR2_9ACTN|nr:hypothetical protein GA0070611_4021 [Micromonospora auratinigra]
MVARISYNDHVERTPRRRLRSATVQLGTLTVLALALSGCNGGYDDDDDDCALGPAGGGGDTVALALRAPAPAAARDTGTPAAATLPDRGGFGTHLASCGG